MENIQIVCSGYTAENGNDIIAVALDTDGRAAVNGGCRQGGNPSFCLRHGDLLYSVTELTGEAFIQSYHIRVKKDDGETVELLSTGRRVRVPGGELCHLHAGEKALYASCYGSGDFCAVDYGLTEILWHQTPFEPGKSRAHWVSEHGGILYLSDLGSSRIYRYRLGNGLPEEKLSDLILEEGAGPRQALPLEGGERVLSIQELDGTLRLWKRSGEEMECVQKVRTTAFEGENFPGTICMADEKTVLVCNRGANTVAAFELSENSLTRIGEWATGNWPRHIKKLTGLLLFVNACDREGKLIIFCWENRELIKKGEIVLHGASCTAEL